MARPAASTSPHNFDSLTARMPGSAARLQVAAEREAASRVWALRTEIANRAATLAELVTAGLAGARIGVPQFVLRVSKPVGPSTRSGVQAREHIYLSPQREGYKSIVIGTIDPVASAVELRTFEHLSLLHELRAGAPLPIQPDEYAELTARLGEVLTGARLTASWVPAPPELIGSHAKSAMVTKVVWGLLSVLVAVLLSGYCFLHAR